MRVRRFLILPLLLVTGVTIAVYVMRVEKVRVTGIRSLSASDIVRASGVRTGERILWLRLTEAERRIERIPAVASAVAERSLPGTVVIRVHERVPLARLDGARELVVDAHGVVFAALGEPVAPVLYGWKGKKKAGGASSMVGSPPIEEGARVDVRSRRVLDAIPRFPSALRETARKIVVEPSVVLTLRGGTQIRFGSINDLEAKAQVAQAILASEKGHPVEYVDVRSPSVPVSKRRPPPTPSPSPVPVQPAGAPSSTAAPAASTPPPAVPTAPATPAAGPTPR
jgi:cell division protein FtsQ